LALSWAQIISCSMVKGILCIMVKGILCSMVQGNLCSIVKGTSGGPLVWNRLQTTFSNANMIESSCMNIKIVGTQFVSRMITQFVPRMITRNYSLIGIMNLRCIGDS
jgi:hypothetical protein